MTETQSNDIDAFWQLNDAKEKVIAGAKELMQRFKEVYGTSTNGYSVEVAVDLGNNETVDKVRGWADCSLECLAELLRTRIPDLAIFHNVWDIVEGELLLLLRAFPIKRGDPFEDIDEHVEDSFA